MQKCQLTNWSVYYIDIGLKRVKSIMVYMSPLRPSFHVLVCSIKNEQR